MPAINIVAWIGVAIIVALAILLIFPSVANVAFNYECVKDPSKCADTEGGDIKDSDESTGQDNSVVPADSGSKDQSNPKGQEESFELKINGEEVYYLQEIVLKEGEKNIIEIIHENGNERYCRVSLLLDGSLYREFISGKQKEMAHFGKCSNPVELQFFSLSNSITQSSSVDLDVIVLKDGVGEEGIIRDNTWAASVKMPVKEILSKEKTDS